MKGLPQQPAFDARVRALLQPGEELLLLTETDLDRSGRFGRRWLAVTPSRLMTFADGSAGAAPSNGAPEVELPLKDITAVTTSHMVGQMALEAEVDGRRIELLRCSNSLVSKMGRIAKSLNDACKDGKALAFELDAAEERRCSKCGRLLPEAGSFCPACLKKRQVLARLLVYMKPHWHRALLVTVCTIAGALLALTPPMLMRRLVDDVIIARTGGPPLLLKLVLGLAGIQAGGMLLQIVQGRAAAWLSARLMHDVRYDFFQSVQGLSLRRYDKTQTGALMSRLTHDTSMLNFMFTFLAGAIVPNLLQLVGICAIMFAWNWRLALLVLVPSPVVVVVIVTFYRRMRRLYHRLWQRQARMGSRANDSISGIRVVKAFTQEPAEITQFHTLSGDLCAATGHAESMRATTFPIVSFVTGLGSLLVWYFGGLGVIGGSTLFPEPITFGTLTGFFMYLGMFMGPLHTLSFFWDFINRAMTAAQRLFEITDADQEVRDDPNALPMPSPSGAIRLEGVHFGYLKDRPVLKGIDLDVAPGEMIGLVGRSGVGKTTLTNLICRFYDVDDGAILLDGVDIRKIKLCDLRRQIGIVPQESFLFNASIAENIAYGKPGATREEIIDAAIHANAHDFIMRLPDGYDTRAGERGARLSGGEKQRIAIARAILRDPRILILDEATSSVDTETEELIQAALGNLVRNRTTFAIAHRLSTLKRANRLVVIEDGKVAELGTHEELMEKKGVFHNLVQLQSRLSAITAVDG